MKHKRLILILLLVICLGCGWLTVRVRSAAASSLDDLISSAAESDDPLEAYRQALEDIRARSEEIQDKISEKKDLISGLKTDISDLDAQLVQAGAQLSAANLAITELEDRIALFEQQLASAEADRATRQAYLEQRLVQYYVYGDISILDVVLQTTSFEDFLTLVDMVDAVVENDEKMVKTLVAEIENITLCKAELEKDKQGLVEVRNSYYDAVSDLNRLESEKAAALNEANMTLEEYEAYEDSLSATAEAVTDTIRDLMRTTDTTLSYGGSMIWPLPAQWGKDWVTSDYGSRLHPVYQTTRFHSGIDIAADGGTPIYAAADGKVILREYYGGYGNCIIIDHGDGVASLYGHMSAYGGFAVGDKVFAGEVIGYVGTTGTSTGNHLHFETRLNGDYVSPWNYLN